MPGVVPSVVLIPRHHTISRGIIIEETPYLVADFGDQKFLKKVVAFSILLCYNNFCPLERGRNRRTERFTVL